MDALIQPLADAIYADRVKRARNAPTSQKMGWGPELFEEACERMRMGIRHQFPETAPADVERILLERLDRLRRVHEHSIYSSASRP